MKQIDLEPRGYRPTPVKGEPVFVPGGGTKLAIHAAVLGAVLLVNVGLYFLIAPAEPYVRAFIATLLR